MTTLPTLRIDDELPTEAEIEAAIRGQLRLERAGNDGKAIEVDLQLGEDDLARFRQAREAGYLIAHTSRFPEPDPLTDAWFLWCASSRQPCISILLGEGIAEVTLDMFLTPARLADEAIERIGELFAAYREQPRQDDILGDDFCSASGIRATDAPQLAEVVLNIAQGALRNAPEAAGNVRQ